MHAKTCFVAACLFLLLSVCSQHATHSSGTVAAAVSLAGHVFVDTFCTRHPLAVCLSCLSCLSLYLSLSLSLCLSVCPVLVCCEHAHAQVLGRADNLSSFVMHGVKEDASVTVELYMPQGANLNITRTFSRKDNQSKWHINGRCVQ